jgi:hypothetical protein
MGSGAVSKKVMPRAAFPSLAHYLLATCLTGLVLITAVNLWGIAESARLATR